LADESACTIAGFRRQSLAAVADALADAGVRSAARGQVIARRGKIGIGH
jgi:hypothetical protein